MIDTLRENLEASLAKPLPERDRLGDPGCFDPWEDVIHGIYGSYNSASDVLMIAALKAVRDRTTRAFMTQHGFAGEFALYVLAGHDLLEYGTSPRFGWPNPLIDDLWQPLIEKWESWTEVFNR